MAEMVQEPQNEGDETLTCGLYSGETVVSDDI
jgi:hypothetical protein